MIIRSSSKVTFGQTLKLGHSSMLHKRTILVGIFHRNQQKYILSSYIQPSAVSSARTSTVVGRAPTRKRESLILLDRDGVLNIDRGTWVQTPDQLELIPGSGEAVAALNKSGYYVAVVTNQSCVGRGLISTDMLGRIHHKLLQEIALHGGSVDKIFFAPDTPEKQTDRRKPGPGMLLEAMSHFSVSANKTTMIGDSLSDMQAAKMAGINSKILVTTGHGIELVEDELGRSFLEPPFCVLDSSVDNGRESFGKIPPDVLPITIYADLSSAINCEILYNDIV